MKKRTYVDKPLGDTEYLLENWGSWRKSGMGVPSYVSPLAALMSQCCSEPSETTYVITDDTAMLVDSTIARLITRNQQMGDFIWWYFGSKWTMVRIAEANKMSERSAREIIRQGVAWIDGALGDICEAA
ncbi:Prophage PssSM-03, putative antitermination protein Q [Pseudomonas caricapapayae]|uniref:Prophage PssSM-03, putative antitermination protein Q n=1 Tax=Pseudomonas caricapapayae TaxID=46678 RepID=A0A0P9K404_9PSED|nr:antiterminator Q family protein [Pseudomonas caricapapayae]KAA8692032.1 antitermination protein Q [Pseudomonas caricapapayae]KPW57091.1 Prophage PssSM-03, putative antitermination protein Q [Pseudomonas caricapapayae]RMM11405.1 Prophage PssSM-03, putative antitermination protein Q [Pseudomonas caricapapayae]RMV91501.1 Prophage PssSM-03, putative antitermination protein Q [Pseudomonas caricapapayae]